MKDVSRIPFINKHSHERIIGKHLFKECSNRSYAWHDTHGVLYGSHANPVLSTYIPEGTIAKLINQVYGLHKLINKADSMSQKSLEDKSNAIIDQNYIDTDIFKPTVVDNTVENDEKRNEQQAEREYKREEQKKKQEYRQEVAEAKKHPMKVNCKSWENAYTKLTNILMHARFVGTAIDKWSMHGYSKTDKAMYLTVYYDIADHGFSPIRHRKAFAHKIGCSNSTVMTGIHRASSYRPNLKSSHIDIKYDKHQMRVYMNVPNIDDLLFMAHYKNPQGFNFVIARPSKKISHSELESMATKPTTYVGRTK